MSSSMFSQTIRRGIPVALLLVLWPTSVRAAGITLGKFVFDEVAGDFNITGGEVKDDVYRLFQDVTGPDIDLFASIEGLRHSGELGFKFESVLTNRTDTPWVFFDHELQEQLGKPSPEEDGLSFAQGVNIFRPFTSNHFSAVDEVTDQRDFINFSEGVVNPNEKVSFRYVILDNTPNDVFFLRQRPNFAPGSVGVVTPPPVPDPVVTPPVPVVPIPLPKPPVPTVPPTSQPISPSPSTVPEPSVILGLLGLLAWYKTRLQGRWES